MTALKYFERQLKKVREDVGAKKSTAELLKELNSLKGLNVEERAAYKTVCAIFPARTSRF